MGLMANNSSATLALAVGFPGCGKECAGGAIPMHPEQLIFSRQKATPLKFAMAPIAHNASTID
jgi:hypothetical protein